MPKKAKQIISIIMCIVIICTISIIPIISASAIFGVIPVAVILALIALTAQDLRNLYDLLQEYYETGTLSDADYAKLLTYPIGYLFPTSPVAVAISPVTRPVTAILIDLVALILENKITGNTTGLAQLEQEINDVNGDIYHWYLNRYGLNEFVTDSNGNVYFALRLEEAGNLYFNGYTTTGSWKIYNPQTMLNVENRIAIRYWGQIPRTLNVRAIEPETEFRINLFTQDGSINVTEFELYSGASINYQTAFGTTPRTSDIEITGQFNQIIQITANQKISLIMVKVGNNGVQSYGYDAQIAPRNILLQISELDALEIEEKLRILKPVDNNLIKENPDGSLTIDGKDYAKWGYDYSRRQYIAEDENGEQIIITIGDEAIIVNEGGVVNYITYNNYYGNTEGGTGGNTGGGGSGGGGFWEWITGGVGSGIGDMLSVLGELLGGLIGGLLQFLVGILTGLISALGDLVVTIGELLSTIPAMFGDFGLFIADIFSWLPTELMVIITFGMFAVVAVAIIRMILNR